MNSNQENKVSMYFKVRTFFTNNQAALAANVPALTAKVDNFNTLLATLSAHDMEATTINSGYATQKNALRTEMRDRSVAVAGALKAFFLSEKDNVMYEKVGINKSSIDKSRDTDALFKCKEIASIANDKAASIAPYGISAAKLTALDDIVDSYEAFIQNPRDRRSISAAAGLEVDKDIAKIDYELMVIDGMMDTQVEDFPSLYAQYKLDRAIDDESTGNGSAPDMVMTIAPNVIQSLYTVPYLPSRSFKVKNTGNGPVNWGLSQDPNLFTNPMNTIEANSTSTKLSSTLGINGDYLVFQNTTPQPIIVEISILE